MAQHDYNIANAGGATVRADINNVLAAVQSLNSGTGAPSSTVAGMLWLDTAGGLPYALKIRDGGNNHWLTIASVNDPGSDGNIETSATIKGTIDTTATFPGPGSGADGGHILQVKSAIFSGEQVIAITAGVTDITNLSCALTITSGNKIFIMANVEVGFSVDAFGALYVTDGSNNVLVQNTGASGNQVNASVGLTPPDADDGDVYLSKSFSFHYLWTPSSGTSHTVKMRGLCKRDTGDSIYINRMEDNSNADHHVKGTSSLTIFEVQA